MKDKNTKNEQEEILNEERPNENQEVDSKSEQKSDNETKEEALANDLAKEKDKFLRLFAEFENYKKRTSRERIELFKTAGEEVLSAMLPILDDFDRALAQISKSEDKELLKGVELIHSKFLNIVKGKGLSELAVNTGDVFDSEQHEAITQIPAPSEDMKGKIIDVVEKGYQLSDKIIRYPKVVVGK